MFAPHPLAILEFCAHNIGFQLLKKYSLPYLMKFRAYKILNRAKENSNERMHIVYCFSCSNFLDCFNFRSHQTVLPNEQITKVFCRYSVTSVHPLLGQLGIDKYCIILSRLVAITCKSVFDGFCLILHVLICNVLGRSQFSKFTDHILLTYIILLSTSIKHKEQRNRGGHICCLQFSSPIFVV